MEAKTPQKGAPQKTQNAQNSAIAIKKAMIGIATDSTDFGEGIME